MRDTAGAVSRGRGRQFLLALHRCPQFPEMLGSVRAQVIDQQIRRLGKQAKSRQSAILHCMGALPAIPI